MNAHGRQFYPQFYVNGNFLNVRIVMLGSQDDVVPFTVGQLKKMTVSILDQLCAELCRLEQTFVDLCRLV